MSGLLEGTLPAGIPRAAFVLSVALLAVAPWGASAQCSQAIRPEVAFRSAVTAESPHGASASGESSSAGTFSGVRFATGSAITVLENTPLQILTDSPISSRTSREGAKLPFTVTRDVAVDGILVIPCGARVYGTVVATRQANRAVGASSLTLQLTELELDGKTYPLYTPPFKVVGKSKTRPTVAKAATGAAVGALVMDSAVPTLAYPVSPADRAKGDSVLAGVGASVGMAIAVSTPPSVAVIPAESQIEFTLASPVAVFPVDQRTAARLARGMYRGEPALYIRGESQ